jgi:hypothetical protein
MKTDKLPLQAASAGGLTASDDMLMWMPGGTHYIKPGLGDNAKAEIWVKVDKESAKEVQASFEAFSKEYAPQRAFFDKEHEAKDATAWPTEFVWMESPKPGIYARCEFTKLGRELIDGKVQRGFSPTFFTDAELPKRSSIRAGETYSVKSGKRGSKENPARITDIHFPSAGGFTNFPAFRNNLPLWAKHAGATSTATTADNTMKTKAELEAEIQRLTTEVAELSAADQNDPSIAEGIVSKNNEIELTKAQLAAREAIDAKEILEKEVMATRRNKAQEAVSAAVKRGAIPAKDTALQAKWVEQCTADPDAMLPLLARVPGTSAMSAVHTSEPRTRMTASVTRESNERVLSELSAICARQGKQSEIPYSQRPAIAREFASLYAREIVSRINDGDDMPLKAANSLGTLAQTLVATRTLEILTQELPMLKAITTDFSDQIVSYGDSLKTRIVGIPSVQTYNTTTGWPTNSDVTTTDVTITYNQFKGVPIQFLGHEVGGTIRRLFDEVAPAQAWALADNMVDYVLALITAGNFSNSTLAALVDFDRSIVIDMGTEMRGRGVPAGAGNRTLMLNSAYFGQLAKDSAIVSLAANQRADIITDGILPNVHGFRVIDAPTLPTTGNLVGFGFSKSALVLASRLSADYVNAIPGSNNGSLSVVTTPSGFSANLVQYVNHSNAASVSRLEVIYGASAGQGNAGERLISA